MQKDYYILLSAQNFNPIIPYSCMLREKLIEVGAIKFGDFTLTSGKRSSYYIDIKKASTKVEILKMIAEEISKFVTGDLIAGVELGAVPLVVATALKKDRNYLIIRKEKRTHGTGKLIEGEFESGQRVDLIEDVVTTGASVVKAIRILKAQGLIVNRVICVVDREEGGRENIEKEGVELISLLKAREIISSPDPHHPQKSSE